MNGNQRALVNGGSRVRSDFDTAEAYPEPLITFSPTSDAGRDLLAERREHFWMPGARVFTGNRVGRLRDPASSSPPTRR